jgi:5-methylcytosine-specific restriction endonuclease McrA
VAASLVDRLPEVVEPLRDGRLCFTTVVVVAGVLTKENVQVVLPRFFGLSKQEALELAAELRPRARVPVRTVVTQPLVRAADPKVHPGEPEATSTEPPAPPPPPPSPRTVVEPLTPVASRMHLTVSRELIELLKRAKAGQSHVQPGVTDEQVILAGLRLLVAQQERRRASVPAKVKREVLERDGGRCQWPTHDGGICGATVRLEVDHVTPRGQGGPSTVDNCRILCRSHNLEAARIAYGDELMDLYVPIAWEGPYSIGIGPTSQISSAYCRMVRSDEKRPLRATLRIAMRVQRS